MIGNQVIVIQEDAQCAKINIVHDKLLQFTANVVNEELEEESDSELCVERLMGDCDSVQREERVLEKS